MNIVVRCNSVISDSRANKYIDFCKRTGIPYKIRGWDRRAENIEMPNASFYKRPSGYQVGGLKAAIDRMYWMLDILRYLFSEKDVKVVHACDLDAAFPATVYKLFHRKTKVIFDVFDWYSDNLGNQNAIFRLAFRLMERMTVKLSDEIIICEPERRAQIPYKLKKEPLVLPNIPSFSNYDFLKMEDEYAFQNDLITLCYVGTLIDDRCLDELLQLAIERKINLLIAGFGNAVIEGKCRKAAEQDNVKFFGKVTYDKALIIEYNADVIYAMYPKISRNNVFAAPNKYYESMLLGKPFFSTKGTILEDKILKYDIGYVAEENYQDILQVVTTIKKEDILRMGTNAKKMWDEVYCDATERFLQDTYINLLEK